MSKVAAVQLASGPNVGGNLNEVARLISMSTQTGAELVVLPENFAIMGMSEKDKVAIGEQDGDGPIQEFLSEQARKHSAWIVGGTIPMASADQNKVRAASLLYNDKGDRVARYDKTHLFDVHIDDSNEDYMESETIEAGDEVVVVDTPFGKLGMAVCYDLRFPEMFRNMVDKGVELIVIPSAFTAATGKDHWDIMVRTRAVENLCYVVAADQGGYHVNGRESHGDSMIVDPWGHVLDRLGSGSGFVVADISLDLVSKIRRNFPVLEHRNFVCSGE